MSCVSLLTFSSPNHYLLFVHTSSSAFSFQCLVYAGWAWHGCGCGSCRGVLWVGQCSTGRCSWGICVWGAGSAFGMPGQVSVVAGCLSLHLLPPITYNNFLWGILLLRHILEQYVNDNSSGFDQTSQKFQTWILQTKKECNQKTTLQKYYPKIVNQY